MTQKQGSNRRSLRADLGKNTAIFRCSLLSPIILTCAHCLPEVSAASDGSVAEIQVVPLLVSGELSYQVDKTAIKGPVKEGYTGVRGGTAHRMRGNILAPETHPRRQQDDARCTPTTTRGGKPGRRSASNHLSSGPFYERSNHETQSCGLLPQCCRGPWGCPGRTGGCHGLLHRRKEAWTIHSCYRCC